MSDGLRIALLGAGHIGGSFALALRAADPSIQITAYDAQLASAEKLVSIGGATRASASIDDAVKEADIVVLAAPVRAFRALGEVLVSALKPGTIITDVGSVKNSMLPLVKLLPQARVIPAHPIAGTEKTGVAAARGDMFRGKLAILTPPEDADPAAVQAVETLWHLAGTDVLAMPVEVHDHIYAYVSHLPHLIAFVAAAHLQESGVTVATGDATLQRFLRISRSNPRMWADIFLENREAMLPALAAYIAVLQHFAAELRAGEPGDADRVALAKHHLPRILAASLISSVSLYEQQSGMELRPFGAGGMRDIAAPAAEAPEAAMEEISGKATAMADVIDAVIPRFQQLEKLIGAEDEAALFAAIVQMVRAAETLTAVRQ